ncbi:NAD(P)/FAD-dependent oxidoreductase [Lentilactobacillus sp. SPB1-3]|uniref:NAD(P)/FAD-dependent oxidoreductase n=1 Tax=Lentilactobacillus terminaliae TaxID=3003483 RepID=A0ACD5DC02_9LACO|nr:FAD-dependent oxidoreductase [Lentilactobacillus sp. SPB1-3]MCZ0977215.1 FAD-dependent oxidoreductase [Lentilactobacillus sp. SPB1-3]
MRTVAVIGGGIIGATAAYYLAQDSDLQVTLFDDSHGQATKAASGIISPWLSKRRNKRWYNLASAGAEFYEQLVDDANLDENIYEQTGTIVTRKDDAAVDDLYNLAMSRLQDTKAIGTVKKLTADEIEAIMPIVNCDESGIYVSGGAKINGQKLVNHLISAAEGNGMTTVKHRVKISNNNEVILGDERSKFDYLVLAPGAFLKELLTPLGYEVDIRPQKGQLVDFRLTDKNTDRLPVMMPESENDIIPFKDGIVTIGATHENDQGFDLEPTENEIEELTESGSKFIPELNSATQVAIRVGTRGYTSDFAPFFGKLTPKLNVFVAGGLGSSGLTTGPIIGKKIADWIIFQTAPQALELFTKPVDTYIRSK